MAERMGLSEGSSLLDDMGTTGSRATGAATGHGPVWQCGRQRSAGTIEEVSFQSRKRCDTLSVPMGCDGISRSIVAIYRHGSYSWPDSEDKGRLGCTRSVLPCQYPNMSEAGPLDELDKLLEACASITNTGLSCRTFPLSQTVPDLADQISQERFISKWLDQKIWQLQRSSIREGALKSAEDGSVQLDLHQQARNQLVDSSSRLQLEHQCLDRVLKARALGKICFPESIMVDDHDRSLRILVLRLRNQLVQLSLQQSRQLSGTRRRIRQLDAELRELRRHCQSLWKESDSYAGRNTVSIVTGDNGSMLTAEQLIQQQESQIFDLVITDLLAVTELDVKKDERLQQLIASRIDEE